MRYYIIYNGKQYGPLEKEQLKEYNLSYDSDVWGEGMPTWVKASSVEELRLFIDSLNSSFGEGQDYYFMMINGQQCGPFSMNELKDKGLSPQSHVWKNGMDDWKPASQVPELQSLFQVQTPPPFMGTAPYQDPQPSHQYAPGQNTYNQIASNTTYTNWMPWAILGTILGFLCSCVGCIFGIIGIIKANSANDHYKNGNLEQAQVDNSSAKTMTIIALALSALGTIGSIIYTIIMASTFSTSIW